MHFVVSIEPADSVEAQACRQSVMERSPAARKLLEHRHASEPCARDKMPQIEWMISRAGIKIPASCRLAVRRIK